MRLPVSRSICWIRSTGGDANALVEMIESRIGSNRIQRTSKTLPAMKSGMAFLDRNENSAASRANFSAATQRTLDGRAVSAQVDQVRGERNGAVGRRRTK